MKRARLAVAGVLAAVAGCAGGNGEHADATPNAVAATATDHVDLPRSYRFAPVTITVRAGTRVTWTNHDVFTHAVQLEGDTATHVMRPGDSVSVVMGVPGLLHYVCPFHAQDMKGTVLVAPGG